MSPPSRDAAITKARPASTRLVKRIENIVRDACAQQTNVFGYGIWTHHITRVARNGKRLARLFHADPEIVEIAALLHDYASVKNEKLYQGHHVHGPIEAERILKRLGFPKNKIEAIKHCIATHRGSVPKARKSPEAECLANADAVSHIENVTSLLHLAFVQHKLGIDEGTEWVKNKLQRSWKKLNPRVQALLRETFQSANRILTVSNRNETPHHRRNWRRGPPARRPGTGPGT